MWNSMKEKILGKEPKGLFFVVSAPAGTGKNTLVNRLLKEFDCVIESISYTTRQPRVDEVEGKEYFFVSKEQFLEMKKEGQFLESAEVFGNYYGTSKKWVQKQQSLGKHVILVIDTQGAMQLKKTNFVISIFIMPPSIEELRCRLLKRNTESDQEIEKRLGLAEEEMNVSSNYDYVLINEELDLSYDILRSIVVAEDHKNRL